MRLRGDAPARARRGYAPLALRPGQVYTHCINRGDAMTRAPVNPRSTTPRLGKWGNSVGVRLPKQVVESSGIAMRDPIAIRAEDGRIVIERRRRRVALRDILRAWPKGERVEEVDWGPARGGEV